MVCHRHACDDCSGLVDCPGSFEPGYEWPSVVCDVYDGRKQAYLCSDCEDARQQAIRDEARAENDR